MMNSGSSANLVGVAALFHVDRRPLQRGDEVIVPAISWATTFHPLQQYGLKLRFVDVELDTLNMDVSKLEAGADAADADGDGGQHPRQSGGARRHPRVLRPARSLLLRGQLRVDGRQPRRPPVRDLRRPRHVQHVLLPPHLDDGRRPAGHEPGRDRQSRARDPQPRLGPGLRAGEAAGRSTDDSGRLLRGLPVHRPRLQRAAARDVRRDRHRAAEEARRDARDPAGQRRAVPSLFAGDERFILQREHGRSSWFCSRSS